MKFFRFLILLLLSLAIVSCSDSSSDDEGDKSPPSDDDTGNTFAFTTVKYKLNGKAENGPCKKPGSILVYPLDSELYQTGNPVYGYISDDSGAFDARGTVSNETTWALYVAENLTCFNEVSAGEDTGIKFFSLTNLTESERNLNPLTTVEYLVAIEYFDDVNHQCYQNIECSALLAHDNVLDYLGFETSIKFQQMSLQGSTLADGILGMVDSMFANGRDANEQNSYMLDVAKGVLTNNQTLKASIQTQFDTLPLKKIKDNLENKYASLGLGYISPPIEELSNYDWYRDLLSGRQITAMTQFNIDDTSGSCTADTNASYTLFAVPFIFNTGIDLSKYLASNLVGDISIWTHGFNVYDRPGTKVLDIQKMNEIVLDSPKKLDYNGVLGDNHGLTPGTKYYIVIRTTGPLVTTCDGGFLPFGHKLASNDNGASWIGHDNNTPWWIKSGVVLYTVN